jgi:hypothetical protein
MVVESAQLHNPFFFDWIMGSGEHGTPEPLVFFALTADTPGLLENGRRP